MSWILCFDGIKGFIVRPNPKRGYNSSLQQVSYNRRPTMASLDVRIWPGVWIFKALQVTQICPKGLKTPSGINWGLCQNVCYLVFCMVMRHTERSAIHQAAFLHFTSNCEALLCTSMISSAEYTVVLLAFTAFGFQEPTL